jgi:hypothetical protein
MGFRYRGCLGPRRPGHDKENHAVTIGKWLLLGKTI